MKPNKEQERIVELEKEVTKLTEQLAGATKRVGELEGQKAPSKSRQQAMAVAKLLEQGPVGVAQLKALNEKYPSDPIYYYRTILKGSVHTVRLGEGKGTVYMSDSVFKTYSDGLAAEKLAAEKAKAEVKAEVAPPKSEAPAAAVIAGAGIVPAVQPAA